MEDILDNQNMIRQRDSEKTLEAAAAQAKQAEEKLDVRHAPDHAVPFQKIIMTGMGGSALAPLLIRSWLLDRLTVPIEVCRGYSLPNHVGPESLVVALSCSGNTEETLEAYDDARRRGARTTVVAKGGRLLEKAQNDQVAHVVLPDLPVQPRMLTISQLVAVSQLLVAHGVVDREVLGELKDASRWMDERAGQWAKEVEFSQNPAKQLAADALGKSAVFFGGPLMSAAAYKWKISWNENAKNVAFWNEYPEFSHNEFIGWTSHPIEKPFAIYDIRSQFEDKRIAQRMALSDKLLSGRRPKATVITPEGDNLLKQLLWASVLADFVSIYLGILNNVDPGPVKLIEKFKQQLSELERQDKEPAIE